MIQAAKIIGTGLAATGLIGAGVGIGVIPGGLILGVARDPSLRGQLFSYAILGFAFAQVTGLFALIIGVTLFMHFNLSVLDFNTISITTSVFLGYVLLYSKIFLFLFLFSFCGGLIKSYACYPIKFFGFLFLNSKLIVLFSFIVLYDIVFIENDQDKIFDEISQKEREYNELEGELEELRDSVLDEEFVSEDEEESTELSKLLKDDLDNKDKLIGEFQEPRDDALFEENNLRKDKSMLLDQLEQSISKDLESVEALKSELSSEDPRYDNVLDIGEKLDKLGKDISNLKEEYHKNDLPLPSSNAPENHFPQDSSDVMPDFSDMPDYNDDV